jgi:hypothetical protein
MNMVFILLFIFCLLLTYIVSNIGQRKYDVYIVIGIAIVLVIISAFRGENVDRDYINYVNFYNDIDNASVEPSFVLISKIVNYLLWDNVVFVFLLYAILGVFIKIRGILKYSDFRFLSILVYISYSYILHDLTQIRAGVAGGLMLLSVEAINNRDWRKYVFLMSLAVLFHYSAAFFLWLWFFDQDRIKVSAYILFIIISIILPPYLMDISRNFYIFVPFDFLSRKLGQYENQHGDVMNIFNTWQLMRIFLSLLFLKSIDVIRVNNRYGVIFVKIYVVASCMRMLLSWNPVLCERISDLFIIMDMVTLTYIVYIVRPRYIAKLAVICISITYLFMNLFYNKLLN